MDEVKKRIAEIKARLAQTTPGPWEPFDAGSWGGLGAGIAIGKDYTGWPVFGKRTEEPHIANSFFCAHARDDVPWLIEQLEMRLTAQEDSK